MQDPINCSEIGGRIDLKTEVQWAPRAVTDGCSEIHGRFNDAPIGVAVSSAARACLE
jgi:hypothetical protein